MNCTECEYEPDWVLKNDGQYGTCKLIKNTPNDRFILTYGYDNKPVIRENNLGKRFVQKCFIGVKKWK